VRPCEACVRGCRRSAADPRTLDHCKSCCTNCIHTNTLLIMPIKDARAQWNPVSPFFCISPNSKKYSNCCRPPTCCLAQRWNFGLGNRWFSSMVCFQIIEKFLCSMKFMKSAFFRNLYIILIFNFAN
jgi:hypothetical protein